MDHSKIVDILRLLHDALGVAEHFLPAGVGSIAENLLKVGDNVVGEEDGGHKVPK